MFFVIGVKNDLIDLIREPSTLQYGESSLRYSLLPNDDIHKRKGIGCIKMSLMN